MIDALEMQQVEMSDVPHSSHDMGEWMQTIVACASNDRFGRVRTCKNCGLQDVMAGGAESHYFDHGLTNVCES